MGTTSGQTDFSHFFARFFPPMRIKALLTQHFISQGRDLGKPGGLVWLVKL